MNNAFEAKGTQLKLGNSHQTDLVYVRVCVRACVCVCVSFLLRVGYPPFSAQLRSSAVSMFLNS